MKKVGQQEALRMTSTAGMATFVSPGSHGLFHLRMSSAEGVGDDWASVETVKCPCAIHGSFHTFRAQIHNFLLGFETYYVFILVTAVTWTEFIL